MGDDLKPTPGIELMHPKMARRHFAERVAKLRADVLSLPPQERLRFAADLLENVRKPGDQMNRWAVEVIDQVRDEVADG